MRVELRGSILIFTPARSQKQVSDGLVGVQLPVSEALLKSQSPL